MDYVKVALDRGLWIDLIRTERGFLYRNIDHIESVEGGYLVEYRYNGKPLVAILATSEIVLVQGEEDSEEAADRCARLHGVKT